MLKGPCVAVTGVVLMVKVAEVEPAGINTLAGIVAAAFALVNVTNAPLAGALPLSATVPLDVLPPKTVDGLTEKEVSIAGFTVRTAFAVEPL
jgi:hypothetical protein